MTAQEETNFYNPDGEDQAAGGAPRANAGSITWTAAEYVEHKRGIGWYFALLVVTAGFAAGLFFLTKDYFATGIIVVLGIIVAAYAGRKPGQVQFELSNKGIQVGNRHYAYNLFKSFSIVHEGAQASLFFVPLKRFMPPVSAYIDPKDEAKIADLVGEHLPYEDRNPSAIDRLSFRLRL